MKTILEEINTFRVRIRDVYEQDDRYWFDFDVTMTERRNLINRDN